MNLRTGVLGGLAVLVLASTVPDSRTFSQTTSSSEKTDGKEMRTSRLESWYDSRPGKENAVYWFLDGKNVSAPFLRDGEFYALKGSFHKGQARPNKVYSDNGKIIIGDYVVNFKNIDKVQPTSSSASFEVDINYCTDESLRNSTLTYDFWANQKCRDAW